MNSHCTTIVNLPFIILNRIIRHIENNIDRICFSLVCQRWFQNINHYLIFDNSNLPLTLLIENNNNHNNNDKVNNSLSFNLKSYKTVIKYSRDNKIIENLFIGFDGLGSETFNKLHSQELKKLIANSYTISNLFEIKEIPKSVKNVYFYNTYSIDKSLIGLLGDSNVTNLDYSYCDIVPTSNNITIADILPPNIKSVNFGCFENYQDILKVLPSSLETLHIGLLKIDARTSNTLPSNLKHLIVQDHYYINQFSSSIESIDLLPSTLESFQVLPCRDLRVLKSSSMKIKSLEISFAFEDRIKVGDIPSTVNRLILRKFVGYTSAGIIPNSVKILDIGDYNFYFDSKIFPVGIEELHIGFTVADIALHTLPNTLKRLYIHRYSKSTIGFGFIPKGVELLEISCDHTLSIDTMTIPNTVKTLIHNIRNRYTLTEYNYFKKTTKTTATTTEIVKKINYIPSSVETFYINIDFFQNHSIRSLPVSIVNLIVTDRNIIYQIKRVGYDKEKDVYQYLVLYSVNNITTFNGGFVDDQFFNKFREKTISNEILSQYQIPFTFND